MAEIPLQNAAVKHEQPTSFSVITPDASYVFQSELEKDISIWVGEITAVCNKLVLDSINTEDKSHSALSETVATTVRITGNSCDFLSNFCASLDQIAKRYGGWHLQVGVRIVEIQVSLICKEHWELSEIRS